MKICTLKRIRKLYHNGSVCVCGQRGTGKDLLMGNVAVRSPRYYANIDYGGNFCPIDFTKLDIQNDYTDLVNGNVKTYVYPYEQGVDLFVSDIGVYFPSQYCNELNKKYPRIPYFLALSRQLTKGASLHWNCQALPRCWDKFREQSDTYILTRGVFKPLLRLGLVIQRVRVYELYDSCVRRVPPFRLPKPSIASNKEIKQNYEIEKSRYEQTNGYVKDYLVVYRNKAKYDTYHFKTLLESSQTSCD